MFKLSNMYLHTLTQKGNLNRCAKAYSQCNNVN